MTIIIILLLFVILYKPFEWFMVIGTAAFFQKRKVNYYNSIKDEVSDKIEDQLVDEVDLNKKDKESLSFKEGILAQKPFFIEGLLRYTSVRVGLIPSHYIRNWIYKNLFMMTIEDKATFYARSEVWEPHKIKVGKGTIIGDKAFLDGRYGISFGENVNLGTGVKIFTNQHDVQSPSFSTEGKYGPVTIGNRVWLSTGSVVLPNITIGEGAVVAAGSVVTKDLDAYGIYGGIPAKKIGERTKDLNYEFDGSHLWFY